MIAMRFFIWLFTALFAFGQGDWRIGELEGRQVRYQVIDGQAVWQGDIVLGPLALFEEELRSKNPGRFSSVITGQNLRWTGNVIPYVIDDGIPDPARIDAAIQAWNSNTPIRLMPRGSEQNYLQFRRSATGSCSSSVGMRGGRQFINVIDNCPAGSLIHEIGHTVGLYHTQSREDRNMFLRVVPESIDRDSLSQYDQAIANADDVGGYPYDSIMHYGVTGFALPGRLAMETIPSGIPLGQRAGLSPSDIDTVQRISGEQPRRTVITTNPPGLEVIVDGRRLAAPVSFDWPAGSTHTLSIDDQTTSSNLLRFGRWSNFGARTQTITASLSTAVYTAHLRRFVRLPLAVAPLAGGRLSAVPAPENGWVPEGTLVRLQAEPAPGYAFVNWSGSTFNSVHGGADSITVPMTSSTLNYTANFSRSPLTTITTAPPGLRLSVDGVAYTSPVRFAWIAGSRHQVSIETLTQTTLAGAAEQAWRSWDDGGNSRHEITASNDSAIYTAEFVTSYRLLTSTSPSNGGRLTSEPAALDGFLPANSEVALVATPIAGFAFDRWGGTESGRDSRRSILVTGEIDAEAWFAQPGILTAAGLVHGASFLRGAIAPGQILTIFGLDLGPDELAGLNFTAQRRVSTAAGGVRVLFDGTPGAMLYASNRQLGVIAPFNLAGKTRVLVQVERLGRPGNAVQFGVAPTAPALFTADSSGGGGGAILNADGSLNTGQNPADRGGIVVLYATGFGVMQPAMADGEVASAPYPKPVTRLSVRIADRDCEVLYAGAAPGAVAGLIQINVRVPADIDPGNVPVVLEAAGAVSPRTVSLAVR